MYIQEQSVFKDKARQDKKSHFVNDMWTGQGDCNLPSARLRRVSAEKAIIRFAARGVLDYEEAKAAFVFLDLMSYMKRHPVCARTLHPVAGKSRQRNSKKLYSQGENYSSKQNYDNWCQLMLAKRLEPLAVLDYVLNGTPFSRIDKRLNRPRGWAMQQFVEGMRLFRSTDEQSALLTQLCK